MLSKTSKRKTDKDPDAYPVSHALRRRGLVPSPRFWVRPKDLPKIHAIARRYADEVNQVRAEVHARELEAQKHRATGADPRTDRDAAWDAIERAKGKIPEGMN